MVFPNSLTARWRLSSRREILQLSDWGTLGDPSRKNVLFIFSPLQCNLSLSSSIRFKRFAKRPILLTCHDQWQLNAGEAGRGNKILRTTGKALYIGSFFINKFLVTPDDDYWFNIWYRLYIIIMSIVFFLFFKKLEIFWGKYGYPAWYNSSSQYSWSQGNFRYIKMIRFIKTLFRDLLKAFDLSV